MKWSKIVTSLGFLGFCVTSFATNPPAFMPPGPDFINCTTSKSFEHVVYSNRCIFSNEVMTGIQQLTPTLAIYCAEVQVTCNGKKIPVEALEQDE